MPPYLIYLTEYHDVKKEEDILDTNVDTLYTDKMVPDL